MATCTALTASPFPGHPAFVCSGCAKKGSAVSPGLGSCVWGGRSGSSILLPEGCRSFPRGRGVQQGSDAPGRKEQSRAGASPGMTASRAGASPGQEGASHSKSIPWQEHPRAGASPSRSLPRAGASPVEGTSRGRSIPRAGASPWKEHAGAGSLLRQVCLRAARCPGLWLRRAPPARAVPVGAVWEEPPGTAAPAPPPPHLAAAAAEQGAGGDDGSAAAAADAPRPPARRQWRRTLRPVRSAAVSCGITAMPRKVSPAHSPRPARSR